MANSGKQSPLGVNALSTLLQDEGLNINPVTSSYVGSSRSYDEYFPGKLVTQTVLRMLTYAIHYGYYNGEFNNAPNGELTNATFNNLIAIGANVIPALGNSPPNTFTWGNYDSTPEVPPYESEPANTGNPTYNTTDERADEQVLAWLPYNVSNGPSYASGAGRGITQWGFIRCYALQAWNEYNWNGIFDNNWNGVDDDPEAPGNPAPGSNYMPEYRDFLSSMAQAFAFIEYTNKMIYAMQNSLEFLDGTYSNMNSLITGDVADVTLATNAFGQDLIALGKAIDLSTISTFGLPSNLLINLRKNNGFTQSLSLALLASGLRSTEIEEISSGVLQATTEQEQQMYGAFLIIVGQDLLDILVPLNCKTQGLESLADLVNVKKLFPNSYYSLTVPIYNATPGITNSKTYYPIYEDSFVSSRLSTPAIAAQIEPVIPQVTPPVIEQPINEPEPTAQAVQQVLQEVIKEEFPFKEYIQADAEDYLARVPPPTVDETPLGSVVRGGGGKQAFDALEYLDQK